MAVILPVGKLLISYFRNILLDFIFHAPSCRTVINAHRAQSRRGKGNQYGIQGLCCTLLPLASTTGTTILNSVISGQHSPLRWCIALLIAKRCYAIASGHWAAQRNSQADYIQISLTLSWGLLPIESSSMQSCITYIHTYICS